MGGGCFCGAPAGTRTPDSQLKRQVLYLLSYWGVWLGWRDSNPLYRSQSPVCYHYTTSQYPRRSVRERGRRRPPASFKWGGIWGSNPRHPEPQSGALPAELIPPYRPRKLRIDSLPRQARRFFGFAEPKPFGFASALARQEGFEPPTYCLEGSCSILLSYWRVSMPPAQHRVSPKQSPAQGLVPKLERVMGIEPTYPAWKAGVLPLNYTREGFNPHSAKR